MSSGFPEFERPLVVLHVDDDPMNLRVVDEILGAFGHKGVRASSGAEALQHLAGQVFDVVLMDVHMPEMSGIETVRALRDSDGPNAGTPVVALTADVMSRQPAEYIALGFQGFASKPIMVASLMESIKRAVTPATVTAFPPLRRGVRFLGAA